MTQTLFERIGGEDTVAKATHYLYVNLFRDDKLKPFFDNIDMQKQTYKMQAFLTMIFGGQTLYEGSSLRDAHKNAVAHGLSDEHVDAMIECVCITLKEMQINNNIIGEVAQRINQYRDEVLNR